MKKSVFITLVYILVSSLLFAQKNIPLPKLKSATTFMTKGLFLKYFPGNWVMEFFSIKLSDKKQSGKETAEIPFPDGYAISNYQTTALTRVK